MWIAIPNVVAELTNIRVIRKAAAMSDHAIISRLLSGGFVTVFEGVGSANYVSRAKSVKQFFTVLTVLEGSSCCIARTK